MRTDKFFIDLKEKGNSELNKLDTFILKARQAGLAITEEFYGLEGDNLQEQQDAKINELKELRHNVEPDFESLRAQVNQNIDNALNTYREQCALELIKLEQETRALDEFYKLLITIMKLSFNYGVDYEEIRNQLIGFKEFLNTHECPLHIPFETIAKTKIFEYFPIPEASDTGYQKFYNIIKTIRLNTLLAHRFEIVGKHTSGGVEYDLHGGQTQVMVGEMHQSFDNFLKTKKNEIASLSGSEFGRLGESELMNILNEACHDVSECVFNSNQELVSNHVNENQMLLLAPTINTENEKHAISITFYNSLCLISDKANDNPGASLFELQGSPDEIKENKAKMALELISNKSLGTDAPIKTTEIITSEMCALLDMKKIAHIPMQAQYGKNCTWSSSAKSVLLSALFFRFYHAAKNFDSIISLSADEREMKAIEIAGLYSKKIRSLWSKHDQNYAVQSYINQASEPSSILLAYIMMKNPHNKECIELINGTNLVTPSDIDAAKNMANELVVELLENELGEEYYKSLSENFPQHLALIVSQLRDLCIFSRKKNTEHVFSLLDFKNDEGSLDKTLNILAREINAIKIPGNYPQAFFSQNQSVAHPSSKDSDCSEDTPSLGC